MEILPAIDVINGRCVRLFKGDYNFKKEYDRSPLEVAREIEAAGLGNLHLIDLEGAKVGRVVNWSVIEAIAKNTGLALEVGGGIRSREEVVRLFNLGVKRIMVGSLAINSPDFLKELLSEFGSDRIMVDVGFKHGAVYYKGWQEKSDADYDLFLRSLIDLGVKFVLLTDIEKDGAMEGPNLVLYEKTVREFPGLRVVASGGVRSTDDLSRLSKAGVWGAVVGKAMHEGKVSIGDLKDICQTIQKSRQ
ncbi:MAG: 1-(5-phosphoribosyl)-5-[(5-phosphoribosylamino)methylideneamino]imidazole-4-carboxamide isomerase [Candidatus Pacebacteria bacterium]|nr:1-(5-phosphoribosyl)-5-[(5-phosphoribosylamino)methylideneamino]imidazole-4-carboxamide isomerase [Candidatus Paceibacterota bacterium]